MRDDDPDYPALVLGNYMLGGGFLNSRLATRIRQKEGLSYGVGSQLQASSLDRTAASLIYAIYAPQNAAKLEAAFKEEVAKALSDGFTAEEVKAAKAGWLQSQQVTRAQDSALAGRLNTLNFLGRTVAWDADFEKRVGGVDAGGDPRRADASTSTRRGSRSSRRGTSPRPRRASRPPRRRPPRHGRRYFTRITTRRFQGSLTPSARSAASGALTETAAAGTPRPVSTPATLRARMPPMSGRSVSVWPPESRVAAR